MRLTSCLLLLALAAAGCRVEPRDDAPSSPPSAPPGGLAAPPAAPAPGPVWTPEPAAGAIDPATGRPEVVLYVTEWCPYCKQAREFMADEGVPHRVVDIEASAENNREYQARGGRGGIPLVAVGTETIEGWSAPVAREMLDAAGYD